MVASDGMSRVPDPGDQVTWKGMDLSMKKVVPRDGLFLTWSCADSGHIRGVARSAVAIVVAVVLMADGSIKTPAATNCHFPRRPNER